MSSETRTVCIEVLLNQSELIRLDEVRGGLARSPYFRRLFYDAARTHGKAPPPARESRGCRGPGRVASRGGASLSQRRQL